LFKPTYTQSVAKAKVLQAVDERRGLVALESLTSEQLVKITGQRKVTEWLSNPEFVQWFYDRDTFKTEVAALRDKAVERLQEILDMPLGDPRDGGITPKDAMAAADMVAKLTGAYPTRAKVIFADRDLNDMGEDEVAAKIAEARAKLEQDN
jgi:hypothetical protein